MSNQSSQSMPPFLPYGYRGSSPFQSSDYSGMTQANGAPQYNSGFGAPQPSYLMQSTGDSGQTGSSAALALQRPFAQRPPSYQEQTSPYTRAPQPQQSSPSSAGGAPSMYMFNRGPGGSVPGAVAPTQPGQQLPSVQAPTAVGYTSNNPASQVPPQSRQLASTQQSPQYFFASNPTSMSQQQQQQHQQQISPMGGGRPLMQRALTGTGAAVVQGGRGISHQGMPMLQGKVGVAMPSMEYMPGDHGGAVAARFSASTNPYLSSGGADRAQSPGSTGASGSSSNGNLLVQHMSHLQLQAQLHHPKWCHYPHTDDTLLPKDRAVYRTAHNLFFIGTHNASANVEKDLHKTLLNRFRQMSLRVESGNKKEEVNFLNEGRYVDLNAMENIGMILSSATPPKRHLVMTNGGSESLNGGSTNCAESGWHSLVGGAHRTVCFRGYDLYDERLVHIRVVIDRAAEAFPHCNAKLSHHSAGSFRELLQQVMEMKHKSLCLVKDVFTCQALQQNSLAIVSDFQPCCVNLLMSHMCDESKAKTYQALLQADNPSLLNKRPDEMCLMKERRAWDYLVQLTSMLHSVHKQGLAYGCMEPSKVLIQEGKRLLLSSVGAWEMLHFNPQEKPEERTERRQRQMEQDLRDLGRLILAVNFGAVAAFQSLSSSSSVSTSTGSPLSGAPNNSIHPYCAAWMKQSYSPEYCQLVHALVEGAITNVSTLMVSLTPHAFQSLEEMGSHVFNLETYALKESLNGRMFRLLTKLNMCCHRPGLEEQESSEVLVLRLFLSFVFHQQSESGSPFIDLAHVITCLTKLEGSSSDRISLVSPTAHVMLVSYADVLLMLNKEFQRLKQSFQYGVMEQAQQQQAAQAAAATGQ